MVDAIALRWFYLALSAWLREREGEALAYLLQENRTLRAQLGHRPLRLTDARRLLRELVNRLIHEGLPSAKATGQHVSTLANFWQLPMYNLEFTMKPVPREELEAAREEELGWVV